ncbi:hypothetical protein OI70_13345 [Dickeya fangzhongdai]|nr:hypothetical protein OI70_13345 [Dickeya fangzhongdai]
MHPISWIIVQQRGALIFLAKITPEIRLAVVQEYLRGFASKKDIGKDYGVGETAIARWLRFWRHLAYPQSRKSIGIIINARAERLYAIRG